jgi:hypothetical protein
MAYMAFDLSVNYLQTRKKNIVLDRKRVVDNKSDTRLVEARNSFLRDHVDFTSLASFDNKRHLSLSH